MKSLSHIVTGMKQRLEFSETLFIPIKTLDKKTKRGHWVAVKTTNKRSEKMRLSQPKMEELQPERKHFVFIKDPTLLLPPLF